MGELRTLSHVPLRRRKTFVSTRRPFALPGVGYDGGHAPYVLVPEARFLVPIGDLDPIEAAPLTDAGLTTYTAIKSRYL
jgi:D-arabinose 1-dehydrogenase-like Zn-dependent alcohol dehydrogenase